MHINNPVFQEASAYPKKHGREALLPGVGHHSRAIIPGDDPGDQQPPERAIPSEEVAVTTDAPSV